MTNWYDSNWDYRKKITIDYAKVDGDLTDFPVLINLNSDSDLSANAQSDSDDILFTKSDGTTKLSHEIESYDGGTGTLWAHVKVPSLSSSSDTTIYVYYGNSGAGNQESVEDVWSNDYIAVYHLDEGETGTQNPDVYKDSVGSNHGKDNVSATGQDGQVYEGQEFDGNDDWILSSNNLGISGDAEFSISAWIRADQFNTNFDAFMAMNNDGTQNQGLSFTVKGGKPAVDFWVNRWRTDNAVSKNQWHQIYGTKSPGDISNTTTIYVDGDEAPSHVEAEDTTPQIIDAEAVIGRLDAGRHFDGDIDEVRYSSVDRSTAWISTTYTNQNDPLSFYSVDSAEKYLVSQVSSSILATGEGTTRQPESRHRSGVASKSLTSRATAGISIVTWEAGIGGVVKFPDGDVKSDVQIKIVRERDSEVVSVTQTDENGKWYTAVRGGKATEEKPPTYRIEAWYPNENNANFHSSLGPIDTADPSETEPSDDFYYGDSL